MDGQTPRKELVLQCWAPNPLACTFHPLPFSCRLTRPGAVTMPQLSLGGKFRSSPPRLGWREELGVPWQLPCPGCHAAEGPSAQGPLLGLGKVRHSWLQVKEQGHGGRGSAFGRHQRGAHQWASENSLPLAGGAVHGVGAIRDLFQSSGLKTPPAALGPTGPPISGLSTRPGGSDPSCRSHGRVGNLLFASTWSAADLRLCHSCRLLGEQSVTNWPVCLLNF